jgi:hypothetical protein
MSYSGIGPTHSLFQSTGTATNFSINPIVEGSLSVDGNLDLATTSASAGQLQINSTRTLHSYGTANIFVGSDSGNFTASGTGNCALGPSTLVALTSGINNVAAGGDALLSVTSGGSNTAIGNGCLINLTSGNANTAIGNSNDNTVPLNSLLTGSFNVAIGSTTSTNAGAGSAYTGSESSNIVISNAGVLGESGVIRIGNNTDHTKCYIGGIYGVTVGGTGIPVVVDNTGNLGTVVSTKRLKNDIKDMGPTDVMKLRPVTFTFKNDQSKSKQHGLIAEEVQDIFPDLVTYDADNKPYSVKYHDLPAILLNELQRLAKRVEILEKNIH